MKTYNLKIGGEEFEARIVEYTETRVIVDLNGDTYEVEISSEVVSPGPQLIRSASPALSAVAPQPAAAQVAATPPPSPSPSPQEASPAKIAASPSVSQTDPAGSAAAVTAPIPGVVKQILVSPGDVVAEGAVVLTLEAMKMENEISAKSAGTVREIHVAVGDSVQEDQLLLDIEAS